MINDSDAVFLQVTDVFLTALVISQRPDDVIFRQIIHEFSGIVNQQVTQGTLNAGRSISSGSSPVEEFTVAVAFLGLLDEMVFNAFIHQENLSQLFR